MFSPSKTVLIGLVTVSVAVTALLYVRIRFAVPTDKLQPKSSCLISRFPMSQAEQYRHNG
jgi:hypothetical protein